MERGVVLCIDPFAITIRYNGDYDILVGWQTVPKCLYCDFLALSVDDATYVDLVSSGIELEVEFRESKTLDVFCVEELESGIND